MTLNEFLDEIDKLKDERILEAERKFLKVLAGHSDLGHLMYPVLNLMDDIRDLENDDFFGTEGMDI